MGVLRPLAVSKLLRYIDMIADTWQGYTPVTAATDHKERLARLQRAYERLATKAGIERPQANIIKWIVAAGLAGATLAAVTASIAVTLVLSSKGGPVLCEPCPAAASSPNADR